MSNPYQPQLITLDLVREHRRIPSDKTDDDDWIRERIEEASEWFIDEIGRTPVPWTQTRLYDYAGREMRNGRELNTGEDLLAISTLTNGDSVVVSSSDYVLDEANVYPKRKIRLKLSGGIIWTYTSDPEQAISVAGTWGYVPHWDNAWKIKTDTDGIGTASVTTITVTDGTTIKQGDYIRIGSEIIFVESITTHVLTVERGVLGSTAASYSDEVDVEQFQQKRDIRNAVLEKVVFDYKARDAAGNRVKVFNSGTVTVEELPPSVMQTIARHRKSNWMVA